MEGTKLNRLIIIGAGGHGKVVTDIAKLCGYMEIVFLDNNPELKECSGYPVLGPDTMTAELEGEIFVAVGNLEIRQKLMDRDAGRVFPTLIHPSAVIAEDAEIGKGSVASDYYCTKSVQKPARKPARPWGAGNKSLPYPSFQPFLGFCRLLPFPDKIPPHKTIFDLGVAANNG